LRSLQRRRWRDLRKITIASVQGNAISAGLMLIWACDLIVAADDAKFTDVVAVPMGMPVSNTMPTHGNSARAKPKSFC
jgi:enoyl-CoA hydratase/carnithine racemase